MLSFVLKEGGCPQGHPSHLLFPTKLYHVPMFIIFKIIFRNFFLRFRHTTQVKDVKKFDFISLLEKIRLSIIVARHTYARTQQTIVVDGECE